MDSIRRNNDHLSSKTMSLRMVHCISPCLAIRRLRTQTWTCLAGLLLVAVGIYHFRPHSVPITDPKRQQNNPRSTFPVSLAVTETLKQMDVSVQQNDALLEKRVEDCHAEKKSLISSLETEKEMHQKTSGKLEMAERSIRKLNQDKAILEANVTIHREFFRYASSMLRDTPYPGVDNYTRYTVARLGMTPLAGIEPLRPEYGPVINDVTSFRYPISVPACGTLVAIGRPSVFVAVVSAAGNVDRRNRIRQTWRTHLDVDYHKSSMGVAGFAFVLGLTGDQATQSKIEQESREHGDVIQIEMSDFYRNLSLKVAGLFNWLHSNCLHSLDFLFKVDDDVYVNVRNLAHFAQSFHQGNQSMFGLSAAHSLKPLRGGKWGISFEEWPWNTYPGYYLGPAVLFSGRTIIPLLAAFQTIPTMPFDDIYVTGMCAEKAGLNRTSFSSNYTTVYAMSQPATPSTCHLRRLISWLTVSASHMNSSHFATQDFYHNRTQCVVAGADGNDTTVDHNEPAQFRFV